MSIFDHPTPVALAAYLKAELGDGLASPSEPAAPPHDAAPPKYDVADVLAAATLDDMLGIVEAELRQS